MEDLVFGKVGEEYGWLTILGEGARDKRNRRTVHVRCRCGKEYDTQSVLLKRSAEPKCRWCANRIKAQMSHGSPNYRFEVDGAVAVGTLPSGDHFVIDAEDIPLVSQRHWYKKSDQNYIISDSKDGGRLIQRIRLHRFLMGLSENDERVVDHINRNPMDCRKSNMRIATQSQNCLNKSIRSDNNTGYIGVSKNSGKYEADIWIAGQYIRLGRANEPKICAQMYNHAAKLLFGEFVGELNNVPEPTQEIKKLVEKRCKPHIKYAMEVTAPVYVEHLKEAV